VWDYDYYDIRVDFIQGASPDGHHTLNLAQGLYSVNCAAGVCDPSEIQLASGRGSDIADGDHTFWWAIDGRQDTFILTRLAAPCISSDQFPGVTRIFHTTADVSATPTPGPPNTKCNDTRVGGNQEGCSACSGVKAAAANVGMARYSIHEMLVSLNIQDTPLRYSPAYGPSVGFTVTYNQRDTQQPTAFNYSNLGPKWTFGWLSYVTDDPNSQLPLTALYRSGGGAELFAYNQQSASFVIDPQSHATLVKTSSGYERRLPDGSKEVFALSDGATSYPRRIFLTEIYDSANNKVEIKYDSLFRVTCLKDALGKHTTLAYEVGERRA
jgi:hypothetical protein